MLPCVLEPKLMVAPQYWIMEPEALASLKVASPVGVDEDAELVLVGSLKCDVWRDSEVKVRGALK
eukprot:6716568-Alexandrium_andersonii.AAC.1